MAKSDRGLEPSHSLRAAGSGAHRESVGEILKDVARRRFAEIMGFALLAVCALVIVALMSWSVRDPSLNHAADGPVRNWLGHPGAIVADVVVQMFGVAVLVLVAPVFRWALLLMNRRRLDRIAARLGAWIVGLFAAAAFASLLPRADSWPLPTGLGGALGDSIERLPLVIMGTSGVAKAAAAMFFAVIAIIALQFATARDVSGAFEPEDDEKPRRKHSELDEDEHRDDEPSRAIVIVGAAIHGTGLAARAAARGFARLRDGVGSRMADGARRIVENATRDDQAQFAAAGGAPASGMRKEPVFTPRPEPQVAREAMSELAAPVYRR
ncbi:MAG: DNA translocase FtsK 4TM domain-containing protein, partial [Beijerinckiaceae bacterium]